MGLAKNNGAIGCKVLGAGKSGYLLVVAKNEFKRNIEAELKKINFNLERINIIDQGLKFQNKIV